MKKGKLLKLMDKYLDGRTTREEIQILKDWYHSYEEQEDYTHLLSEEEKHVLRHNMLQTLLSRTSREQKKAIWCQSFRAIMEAWRVWWLSGNHV